MGEFRGSTGRALQAGTRSGGRGWPQPPFWGGAGPHRNNAPAPASVGFSRRTIGLEATNVFFGKKSELSAAAAGKAALALVIVAKFLQGKDDNAL